MMLEKKKQEEEEKDKSQLLASAFNLYNSQLVMKSLGACGCSAFSQVQTF